MSKIQKHIHKFRRHTYKTTGNQVYFCTLPDCTFKIETELSIGKQCLCNRCDKPFIMNSYSLRLVKPHCEDCHNLNRRSEHGGDRRFVPTRREMDPTVIPVVAEQAIDNLRSKLEKEIQAEIADVQTTQFRSLFDGDDSEQDDADEL